MRHYILPLVATLLLLTACNDSKHGYSIKGTINNLEGKDMYAVYETPEGISIDTIKPDNGYIELLGNSHDYRPIVLYNSSWQPFMRLYMRNGMNIELNGDAHNKYRIEMKGGDLNNTLWELMQENADILYGIERYTNDTSQVAFEKLEKYTQELDSVFIEFVRDNPNEELSSFIITDYLLKFDNLELCNSLWNSLSEKSHTTHSASIINKMNNMTNITDENKRIPYLRYLDSNDSLMYVNPSNSRATLLCVWEADSRNAHTTYSTLQQYASTYDRDALQIVALSFDRDTAVWHKAVEADTTHIFNLWNDDVFSTKVWSSHNISNTPVYMLSDSRGNILVRTSQLPDSDIDAQIDSLLNNDRYKIESPIFKP